MENLELIKHINKQLEEVNNKIYKVALDQYGQGFYIGKSEVYEEILHLLSKSNEQYYCKFCKKKENEEEDRFIYNIFIGINVSEISDFKKLDICDNCLEKFCEKFYLKIYDDNEKFEGLTREQFKKEILTKSSLGNSLIIGLQPELPENYHIIHLNNKELENIKKFLNYNNLENVENDKINSLFLA